MDLSFQSKAMTILWKIKIYVSLCKHIGPNAENLWRGHLIIMAVVMQAGKDSLLNLKWLWALQSSILKVKFTLMFLFKQ